MQNKHRHGCYDYDVRLQAIANRELDNTEHANDYENEDNDNNITGIGRQLQMIEYFNN